MDRGGVGDISEDYGVDVSRGAGGDDFGQVSESKLAVLYAGGKEYCVDEWHLWYSPGREG